jgi:hypothetical protein
MTIPTMTRAQTRSLLTRAAVVVLVSTVGLVGVGVSGAAPATSKLVGTFKISAGTNAGSAATGSFFRMLQPGGKVGTGPYLSNANSSAKNKTYTLFKPGTDGGLSTANYQPAPSPAFDKKGNALAKRIVKPLGFFGKNFSVTTQSKDPQTGKAVPLPSITYDGKGHLTGNVRAFGAWWNNGKFNQGSPKPDGTKPGITAGPTGTYNPKTHQYVLSWTSLIVGGPFNGFTGQWHLQGTFVPKPG